MWWNNMTKKELIKALESVDDNAKIITASRNIELCSNLVDAHINIANFKKVDRQFKDMFDGDYYTHSIYTLDKEGEECILIVGY
jgi:hypothetical protein